MESITDLRVKFLLNIFMNPYIDLRFDLSHLQIDSSLE